MAFERSIKLSFRLTVFAPATPSPVVRVVHILEFCFIVCMDLCVHGIMLTAGTEVMYLQKHRMIATMYVLCQALCFLSPKSYPCMRA